MIFLAILFGVMSLYFAINLISNARAEAPHLSVALGALVLIAAAAWASYECFRRAG